MDSPAMHTSKLGATELLDRAIAGDRRCLARAITFLELRDARVARAMGAQAVRRHWHAGNRNTATALPNTPGGPGAPHVVGITGPPGAGKSTLVDAFVRSLRDAGSTVAVVAVDPSSPFTGGAILGDRIRMEAHTGDDGVFMRSLSSRGHLGGLSGATADIVDLFDAAGYDAVVVETVGVGQSELGVMEVADTVVVVLTPESGDAVQAMKAGLLEIADIFVVNKADRDGADAMVRELTRSVQLAETGEQAWAPPVLPVVATEAKGIAELRAAATAHLAHCGTAGLATWRARRGDANVRLAFDMVVEQVRARLLKQWTADGTLEALKAGQKSPRAAAYGQDGEDA